MMVILYVGVGGMIGAVSRYLIGGFIQQSIGNGSFPLGTLSVNILGCLLIGLLAGLSESRHVFSPEVRALLLVGLLGGFTTFSAFGLETVTLIRDGYILNAVSNVAVQVVVGIFAVWVGIWVVKLI